MIKPLNDHVVLEAIKEEKKKGGIIIPDTADKERSEIGKVVAVGLGKFENGKRIALDVKKGQIITFKKYSDNKLKVGNVEYMIVKEEDILAIID